MVQSSFKVGARRPAQCAVPLLQSTLVRVTRRGEKLCIQRYRPKDTDKVGGGREEELVLVYADK